MLKLDLEKFYATHYLLINVEKMLHAFGLTTHVDQKYVLTSQPKALVVKCGQKMIFYNADGKIISALILLIYHIYHKHSVQ